MGSVCGKSRWRSKKFIRSAAKKIAAVKELLKEGYTVQQLGQALRGWSAAEKSELWVTGKIRELLGEPEPH